nr:DNA-directed RNA polymerase V subunit 1 [Tanacetum cinerariifolium]
MKPKHLMVHVIWSLKFHQDQEDTIAGIFLTDTGTIMLMALLALLSSEDISIPMLKKVSMQVEIIKNSRFGKPNFESLEVEVHDLQVVVAHYLLSRGANVLFYLGTIEVKMKEEEKKINVSLKWVRVALLVEVADMGDADVEYELGLNSVSIL